MTNFLRASGLALIVALSGCASMGANPEADIRTSLDAFHAAQKAGDLDVLMSFYSDDFSSQGATKDMIRPFVQGMVDQGLFQMVEPALENLVITVDGDTAVANPVEYTSPGGNVGWRYTFQKEADGNWRITGADQL